MAAPDFTRPAGRFPPAGLMMLSVCSVQTGAALATRLFAALGPAGTAFWRVLFAAMLLGIAIRPRLLAGFRAHAGLILPLGLAIAAMNLCIYEAIARIPLGLAVTVEFLGPLGVAVLSSRRPRDLAWTMLAATGLALLAPELRSGLDPLGLAFALLAALGWAGFILAARRASRALTGQAGIAMALMVAAAALLPFALGSLSLAQLDPAVLAGVAAVALLSSVVPMSCEYAALRRLTPFVYAILATSEPAVAAIIGAALLGQAMPMRSIGAVAAVTAAALGVTVFDRTPP